MVEWLSVRQRIFFCYHDHTSVPTIQSGLFTSFDDVGVRSVMFHYALCGFPSFWGLYVYGTSRFSWW